MTSTPDTLPHIESFLRERLRTADLSAVGVCLAYRGEQQGSIRPGEPGVCDCQLVLGLEREGGNLAPFAILSSVEARNISPDYLQGIELISSANLPTNLPLLHEECALLLRSALASKPTVPGLIHDLKSSLAAESLLLSSMRKISRSGDQLDEIFALLVQSNELASERTHLLQYLCSSRAANAPNAKRSLSLSLAVLPQEVREAVTQEILGDPGGGTSLDARLLFRALSGLTLFTFLNARRKGGGTASVGSQSPEVLRFRYQSPAIDTSWQRVLSALIASATETQSHARTVGTLAETVRTQLDFQFTLRAGLCDGSVFAPKRIGFAER